LKVIQEIAVTYLGQGRSLFVVNGAVLNKGQISDDQLYNSGDEFFCIKEKQRLTQSRLERNKIQTPQLTDCKLSVNYK